MSLVVVAVTSCCSQLFQCFTQVPMQWMRDHLQRRLSASDQRQVDVQKLIQASFVVASCCSKLFHCCRHHETQWIRDYLQRRSFASGKTISLFTQAVTVQRDNGMAAA